MVMNDNIRRSSSYIVSDLLPRGDNGRWEFLYGSFLSPIREGKRSIGICILLSLLAYHLKKTKKVFLSPFCLLFDFVFLSSGIC